MKLNIFFKKSNAVKICLVVIFFVGLLIVAKGNSNAADTIKTGQWTSGWQATSLRGCWSNASVPNYGDSCDDVGSPPNLSVCGTSGNWKCTDDPFVTTQTPTSIFDCDSCTWDPPRAPQSCATTGGTSDTGAYDCTNVNWGSCSGNGATSRRTCPQAAGQNCTETSHEFSRTCCTTDEWSYSYPQCTTIGDQTQTSTKTFSCTDDTVTGVTYSVNHSPSPQTRTCSECPDLVGGRITNYTTCDYNTTGKCVSNKIIDICRARNNDACVPKSLPIKITILSTCKNCEQNLTENSSTGSNPYTSNCAIAVGEQCNVANSTYKVTCTSTDLTCSNASHDFYPTCPNCTYNTGASCTDRKECNPAANMPQKTTWQCDKQASNPSYCKGSAFNVEQRNCVECTEANLWTCDPSWSACLNGKKTRSCTKKTGLVVGNPNCALPSDCTDAYCTNKFGITETTSGCTSCADTDYGANCNNYGACAGFTAASGIYTATCSSSRYDCTGTRNRSFTPCPVCTYATGAGCTEQATKTCDPTSTTNNTQKFDCPLTDTRIYCFNYSIKTKEDSRSCGDCTESDLYNNCGNWSGCVDGQQKRMCTAKTVSLGNPNCKLPASQKNTDGTDFGQNTKGCGSPPNTTLPTGADGATMFSIDGTWSGSQMIHYDYANKRIGIGTIVPNERLEISGNSDANTTSRLIVSDIDNYQNPTASNGFSSNNPEFRLKYGNGVNEHWAFYVDKSGTPANNSLKIWNIGTDSTGADRVIIDKNGYVHAAKFCTNVGTSGCTELTGGGEQFWTKDNSNNISYFAGKVKIDHADGLGIIGGNSYTYFKGATNQPANIIYTLPSTVGTSGQFLKLGANNALSWSDTGSPDLAQYRFNNLIINSGFEGGSREWDPQSLEITKSEHYSGYQSAVIHQKAGGTTMKPRSRIQIKQNKTYSLSFWIKTSEVAPVNSPVLHAYSCKAINKPCDSMLKRIDLPTGTADWQMMSAKDIRISNGDPELQIEFKFDHTAGEVYLDDIMLTESSTPLGYSAQFIEDSGNQSLLGRLSIGNNGMNKEYDFGPSLLIGSKMHSSGNATMSVDENSTTVTIKDAVYPLSNQLYPGSLIYPNTLSPSDARVIIREARGATTVNIIINEPFPSTVTNQAFKVIDPIAQYPSIDASNPYANQYINGPSVIAANGALGVGGTPQTMLHVYGGAKWGAALSIDASNVKKLTSSGDFIDATAGRRWDLISTGGDHAEGIKKFLIKDVGANKVRLTIDESGNVGIGTTAPSALLTIAGTGVDPGGTPSACPVGTLHFDENGNTIIENGECKSAILFNNDGTLTITKDAGVGKVLVSDANGKATWRTETFSQWTNTTSPDPEGIWYKSKATAVASDSGMFIYTTTNGTVLSTTAVSAALLEKIGAGVVATPAVGGGGTPAATSGGDTPAGTAAVIDRTSTKRDLSPATNTPDPVTGAKAILPQTALGQTSIVTITWVDSPNATNYDVYRMIKNPWNQWNRTLLSGHKSPINDNPAINDISKIKYEIVAMNPSGARAVSVSVENEAKIWNIQERAAVPAATAPASEPVAPATGSTPEPSPSVAPTPPPQTAPAAASSAQTTPTTPIPAKGGGGAPARGGGTVFQ